MTSTEHTVCGFSTAWRAMRIRSGGSLTSLSVLCVTVTGPQMGVKVEVAGLEHLHVAEVAPRLER